ncbi:NADH-quinone oxidoreductase subunit C [Actinotalea sp.]|uniref:hydrogenase large subunit n=1 Tax=Actinotalea sp. TaxID=1872145 RepID=UPI002B6BA72C|nr:NADH-quinone oxidoreductase subunit C [Actinotalea sp.]HRA50805.1 NADH-quinone oxidoreductase subunit C [Actinotalea sp.]
MPTGPLSRADGTLELPVAPGGLRAAAGELLATGHRLALVAAHDDAPGGFHVVYAFAHPATDLRTELVVQVQREDPGVPSLAALSFPAGRFERAVHDQFGIVPQGHPRPRRLVLHDHWPTDRYPMRRDADQQAPFGSDRGSFSFVPVGGQGVYEIPVGPVHAGLIEPGHFRFSVVGETILRMKARLWFLHRGIEKLFEGRTPAEGIELAERVSGDTAVGHGLAYAMAVEGALDLEVSEEDRLVRALLLELERLHNHVADLGAMANDVAFAIANVHAQRLRETLLRLNRSVTGHRLLRGGVSIGGAGMLATPDVGAVAAVAAEVAELVAITLGSSVVADRFTGTAVLARQEAVTMGALGYVARASGLDVDTRRDHPFVDLGPRMRVCTRSDGDVLARFGVRADEVAVSAALVEDIVRRLGGRTGSVVPDGPPTPGSGRPDAAEGEVREVDEPGPAVAARGLSLVEAWRGTACHRVELDGTGRLARVAVVDPSFFTWPALPVSLADTIVPDFPLANKSFNQSYAGNDL